MSAGLRSALSGDPPTAAPAGPPGSDERLLTLVYQVCRLVGRPRGATARLCRRLLLTTPPHLPVAGPRAVDAERRASRRLLTALRAELSPRIERDRLDEALNTAILWYELTLLPPRQRLVLSSAVHERKSVADIATRTGWTHTQVARLLRAALNTVTLHAREQ
jgi:hypothetical protein